MSTAVPTALATSRMTEDLNHSPVRAQANVESLVSDFCRGSKSGERHIAPQEVVHHLRDRFPFISDLLPRVSVSKRDCPVLERLIVNGD